jgi:phosphatidate cytidylyltransferase
MTTLPGEQAPSPAGSKRADATNLIQRLATGLVGLPIVLLAAYAGGWWFVAVVALLTAVGVMEFCALGRSRGVEGNGRVGALANVLIVVGVHIVQPALWLGAAVGAAVLVGLIELARGAGPRHAWSRVWITTAALLYVAFPASLLVATRNLSDGLTWLLLIFFVTWGTDTVAYIAGRLWGRTKLAPAISPKKTVEGAIGGVIGGILPAAIFLGLSGKYSPLAMVAVAAGPLLAILGDLVESGLKRMFRVKDSHIIGFDILPGHGGVLDRVDGLILVTTFTYFFLVLTGLAR